MSEASTPPASSGTAVSGTAPSRSAPSPFAPSPFSMRHREAALLGRLAALPPARGAARLNFRRGKSVKYPMVALLLAKELGHCRHALARRTVAGTMTVHFAFEQSPAKPTSKES